MKPTIGITMGDPLGIGPEITQKALPKFRSQANFKVFGDPRFLPEILPDETVGAQFIAPGPTPDRFPENSPAWAGAMSVAALERAMVAYQAGQIQALVTAPISKAHVKAADFPFPGHTEYLAAKTRCEKFVMMMAGPRLRVTLVTIHEPLAEVAAKLRPEKILNTIEITFTALQKLFHLKNPRLAVCGLNPHAGEGGLIGDEEKRIIQPAVAEANRKGYTCTGPHVPDAVFHEAYEGKWDAVICMYHDQGLIPFKMIHFWDGVNVTLGLPLIRTSPDHGTAFDIAGKGIADSRSMETAIRLAIQMVGGK